MKKSFQWLVIPGLALLCIAVACNKDLQQEISKITWSGQEVNASFFGRIQDESGLAVPDAVVTVGNASVSTDNNGVFVLPAQKVNSARAILTVTKNGYWQSRRTFFVQNNSQNRANFTLIAKQLVGVINGQQGGTLTLNGGASIKFKPASFVSGGQVMNSNVLVYAHFIDPVSPNLREVIPGDLRGLRSNGDEEILQTFGMLGVELTDQSGNAVALAAGQTAEIRADIRTEQLADAPASVPLWHFDEQEGLWKEEGTAQRQGNQYVGEVSHFSWWNYDAPLPAIKISGQFIDQNGSPITNVHVWACPIDINAGWGCGHGEPDDRGMFCGLAGKDIPLTITVALTGSSGCSATIYTATVGPFSSDTDLGVITINLTTIPSITSTTITGRLVDCNGNAMTTGYAYLNNNTALSLNQNGEFDYVLTYCNNIPLPSLMITGFDVVNGKQSQPVILTPAAQVNFGDIPVCDDVDEFIKFSLDGAAEVTAFLPPNDSTVITSEYAFIAGETVNGGITLQFMHNNIPQNDLPLGFLSVYNLYSYNYQGTNNLQVTTNLLTIPPSGYVTGTFSGNFIDYNTGQPHTISGSYKAKR